MDEVMDGRLSALECSESLLVLSGSYEVCWRSADDPRWCSLTSRLPSPHLHNTSSENMCCGERNSG